MPEASLVQRVSGARSSVPCLTVLLVAVAVAATASILRGEAGHSVAPVRAGLQNPVIAVTPRSAVPRQRLTITGYGFGANEQLAFYWDRIRRWPRRDHADAAGAFTNAKIWVAANERNGRHVLVVRGMRTGRAAQTVVVVRAVAAPPPQPTVRMTPSPPAIATPQPSSRAIKTVFLIVLENQDWSSIKGNRSAPYINRTLLPMASYAQQYYNPPGLHPSLPNYLWLEAGTNFGIRDDKTPSVHHQTTHQHFVALLAAAGITWKAYVEGISGSVCPLTDPLLSTTALNPFVYFDDVTNANDLHSSYCIAHERPLSELTSDLQRNVAARYNVITANLCHDMHNACAPLNDPIKQGDRWLSEVVPQILDSTAYQEGGVLFITWDEGAHDADDGPIGLIVLSPDAKGNGYMNLRHYTHSSTLRTMEEIFGVWPLLGDAASAPDLRDLFTAFP